MTKFEFYEGTQDVQWYPEAASQSWKKGQFVYMASGLLNELAATEQKVLGLALADATGITNTWTPVLLAHTDTRFVGQISDDSDADDDGVIAQLALDCEFYEGSNVVKVNTAQSSTDCLRPIAFHPNHIPKTATATIVDATNALVIFKVMDEYSQAVDLDQA